MTSRFPQLRIHHFPPPHQIARSQPQSHQAPPYETREGAKNTIPEPRTSQSSVPRHHGLIIRPQSPPGDGLREGPRRARDQESRGPYVVISATFVPKLTVASRGAVNQALEWLEKNQDKPTDELLADAKADEEDEEESNINVEGEGGANSLVCNDCGKRFRNADLASYHASKTYVYCSWGCIRGAPLRANSLGY